MKMDIMNGGSDRLSYTFESRNNQSRFNGAKRYKNDDNIILKKGSNSSSTHLLCLVLSIVIITWPLSSYSFFVDPKNNKLEQQQQPQHYLKSESINDNDNNNAKAFNDSDKSWSLPLNVREYYNIELFNSTTGHRNSNSNSNSIGQSVNEPSEINGQNNLNNSRNILEDNNKRSREGLDNINVNVNVNNNRDGTRRFEYHLNHFQPPSLVPIMIEHISSPSILTRGQVTNNKKVTTSLASVQTNTNTNTNTNRGANGNNNVSIDDKQQQQQQQELVQSTSGSAIIDTNGRSLVQLHLPLKLHLRLKPLPLPLPPPPAQQSKQVKSNNGNDNDNDNNNNNSNSNQGQERRKSRSLVAGNAQPILTNSLGPLVAGDQINDDKENNSQNWQTEAKRVLVLSSSSGEKHKLERRIAPVQWSPQLYSNASSLSFMDETNEKGTRTPRAYFFNRNEENGIGIGNGNGTTTSLTSLRENSKSLEQHVKDDASLAQQSQGQQNKSSELKMLNSLDKIQSLTAALLPILWPSSLNLISPQTASIRTASRFNYGQSSEKQIEPTFDWPQYVNAIASQNKTILRLDPRIEQSTTTTTTTKEPIQRVKRKNSNNNDNKRSNVNIQTEPTNRGKRRRRKPVYLNRSIQSTTPYPDSVRIASKYPMPKIKFQAMTTLRPFTTLIRDVQLKQNEYDIRTTPTPIPTTTSTTIGPIDSYQTTKTILKSVSQLPKNLEKIVELRLSLNSSDLLSAHRRGQLRMSTSLPPSTSVSRVIRYHKQKNFMTTTSTTTSTTTTVATPVMKTLEKVATLNPLDLIYQSLNSTLINNENNNNDNDNNRTNVIKLETNDELTSRKDRSSTTESSNFSVKSLPTPPYTSRLNNQEEINEVLPTIKEPKTTNPPATMTIIRPLINDNKQTKSSSKKKNSAEISLIKNQFGSTSISTSTKQNNQHRKQQLNTRNQIKLFHFKRKPDLNKLPFYKKPLNYTELGWTNEQILEHLENLALLGLPNTGNVSSKHLLLDQNIDGNSSNGSDLIVSQHELSLLKRKRRGKNQFERLMADLHSGTWSEPSNRSHNMDDMGSGGEFEDSNNNNNNSSSSSSRISEHVPVLRKKSETFNEPVRVTTTTTSGHDTGSAYPMETFELDQYDSIGTTRAPNKTQRRTKRLLSNESGWRPVRLNGDGSQQSERLMLMPSGLLTPSGSQLVPFISDQVPDPLVGQRQGSTLTFSEQGRIYDQYFGWYPFRQTESGPELENPMRLRGLPRSTSSESDTMIGQQQQQQMVAEQTSNLSPSLIRSGLRQGDNLNRSQNQRKQEHQQQQQKQPQSNAQLNNNQVGMNNNNTTSELRVPKLLSKPMRPAKYSLNGYIPKPSLGSLVATQSSQHSGNNRNNNNNNNMKGSNLGLSQHQTSIQFKDRKSFRDNLSGSSIGRDLDSSTTNEVFSRRRGLHHSQRANNANKSQQIPISNLFGIDHGHQTGPSEPDTSSAERLQLEENRRKYFQMKSVEQSSRSLPLSLESANIIRAKLGLPDVRASSNKQHHLTGLDKSSRSNRDKGSTSETNYFASESRISNSDHNISDNDNDNSNNNDINMITPLSSIPKTNFECTNESGQFISGLFPDHKTGCRVWHLCSNNRKHSFLCPSGTIFNAKLRICDWRYNVKCDSNNI